MKKEKIIEAVKSIEWQCKKLIKIAKEIDETLPITPITPTPPEKIKLKHNLALIVGHQENAGGANLYSSYQKHFKNEYAYNSKIAALAKEYADSIGIGGYVKIFYRKPETTSWRKNLANCYDRVENFLNENEKHGYATELHFNAYNTRVSGSTVLYGSSSKDSPSIFQKELTYAKLLNARVKELFYYEGRQNRDVKDVPEGSGELGWYNLAQINNHVSVLMEPAFGDNPIEAAKLVELQQEYAKLLIDVFLDCIDA